MISSTARQPLVWLCYTVVRCVPLKVRALFNSIFPYLNAYIDFFLNISGLVIRTLFFDQEVMYSHGLFMVDCHEPPRSRIQWLVICISYMYSRQPIVG